MDNINYKLFNIIVPDQIIEFIVHKPS